MLELSTILYTGAFGLIVIGLTGMAAHPNLLRMLLSLMLAESGANLLLVLSGFRWDALAPILAAPFTAAASSMVDPIPQAMVLTAIVIGVGVQALALAMLIRVFREHGSLERDALTQRLYQQLDQQADIAASLSEESPGAIVTTDSRELRP